MKPQIVQTIENAFKKSGVKKNTLEAISWYRERATKLGRKSSNSDKLISDYPAVSRVLPGELYLFYYDAKHKETLPVWDACPLIFVLEIYDDGFLGINLHYLPPKLRQIILLQFAGTTRFDKHKANQLNYVISKAILKEEYLKNTIKRYLTNHLRSEIVRVDEADWPIVVFLPLSQFQKKSHREVWKGL
jgi:hypothetical protein